jgi:hypothetical protein
MWRPLAALSQWSGRNGSPAGMSSRDSRKGELTGKECIRNLLLLFNNKEQKITRKG